MPSVSSSISVPVMSDGHQVGRELDALEAEVEDLGQRADEQRLGQARHAGEQAVAAGEERRKHVIDRGFLPHDHLAQLGQDTVPALGYPSHQRSPLVGGERLRLLLRDVVHSFLFNRPAFDARRSAFCVLA